MHAEVWTHENSHREASIAACMQATLNTYSVFEIVKMTET